MRVKAILLAGAAGAALTLAGCGSTGTPSATGSASGNPSIAPSSEASGGASVAGRDGCLIGTWKVDVDDMAKQAAAKVGPGATGKGTGAITLVFGDKMTITYADAVININAPIHESLTMDMKNTFKGEATSTDWVAKDGKLAGTMPTNSVTSTIKMTMGGKDVPQTTTPFQGALDLSEGNLGYTCSGSTATFISPLVTWKLTKA